MQQSGLNHSLSPLLVQNSLNPFVLQWLEKIGSSYEQYNSLISWDLKSLPPFYELKDMTKAVDRIMMAIEKNEAIAIFGDYDVDGTTSCALLFRFFQKIHYTVKLYQPSRFVDGYGLHPVSVEQAHKDGIKLLITVDCGTSSHAAAEKALQLGLDLIITDHHKDAASTQPKSFALINPNRRDEQEGPMQALAGVGVAFALSICLRERLLFLGKKVESLYDLLPYVAIGTIGDLAPLNSMNLILCRHGFKALLQTKDLGLLRFMEKKEFSLEYLESELVSFFIGPMINSKGRLDHPEVALKLLITNQPDDVNKHFEILHLTNQQRKKIQQDVFQEAKADAAEELLTNNHLPALILYRPKWHEGVIGIVASKLVEEFNRPALVFTNSDQPGLIKASVRTALGIDIFSALKTHEQYFKKFGGHKAAAGLTIEFKNFEAFKQSFLQYFSEQYLTINPDDHQHQLLPIDFQDIDGKLLADIYKLAPFGQAHPMPKWRIGGFKISHYEILKENHVKWHFTSLDQSLSSNFKKTITGISFNFFKNHPPSILNDLKNSKENIFIDGWIKVNQFRGTSHLQLLVDRLIL